jgi:hypothetical protein
LSHIKQTPSMTNSATATGTTSAADTCDRQPVQSSAASSMGVRIIRAVFLMNPGPSCRNRARRRWRIRAVGEVVAGGPGAPVIDARRQAVLPGFIATTGTTGRGPRVHRVRPGLSHLSGSRPDLLFLHFCPSRDDESRCHGRRPGRRASGKITPGKDADLRVINLSAPHLAPETDACGAIVAVATPNDIEVVRVA